MTGPGTPTPSADRPATRAATRLAFLVAGFGMACWAPLVPFAKQRLGVDDRTLGLLLLCLGVGSVCALVVTGVLSARCGSRPIIVLSGAGLAATLPLLGLAHTPMTLGPALFAFGASLGSLDVAMNVHAVEVERAAGRPLMSGFHALFSIGGFAGAGLVTLLLSAGAAVVDATLMCSALMAIAIAAAWPGLLRAERSDGGPLLVMPRGVVLVLAGMAAILFLIEGAILDWGALLMTGAGLVGPDRGGLGYVVFSIAMTVGRFSGDALAECLGDRAMLVSGGVVAIAGLMVLLTAPHAAAAMFGFLLVGLGASNLVPVLFRRAGSQPAMPPGLAIAAVTTTGYAGILLGPAAVGFVAEALSLPAAFWMLAGLCAVVPLAAGIVTKRSVTTPH